MSDDLRDLGHRLVADPPHPAPSVDELHDRVTRRRQRRARAIGAASVLVVVVVVGAVLALPRSSELQAGDGITAATTAPDPAPSTVAPTTGAPSGSVTVDLYPDALMPAGEVLPNTIFAVDQNTIAVAWSGPCNQPADQATFVARDGEIELRLGVGTFDVIDCVGESDDWVATFDVPFTITDRVRLVARAEGVDGETERLPELIMGSSSGGSQLPDGTPTSFRATEITDPAEPGVRFVLVQLPYPLVGRVACDVSMSTSNKLAVPAVQVQEASAAGLPPCADVQNTIRLSPFDTIIGQP